MTIAELLTEYDACGSIMRRTQAGISLSLPLRSGASRHVCYCTLNQYRVFLCVDLGTRSSRRGYVTVIDSSQGAAADCVFMRDLPSFPPDSILKWDELFPSEYNGNFPMIERIHKHLSDRVSALLAMPAEEATKLLREHIDYALTMITGSSVNALSGGKAGS